MKQFFTTSFSLTLQEAAFLDGFSELHPTVCPGMLFTMRMYSGPLEEQKPWE